MKLSGEYWDSLKVFDDKSLRIFFVGSLSSVFDFEPLVCAARSGKAQVIIAGEGPAKELLLGYASRFDSLIVPGWISPSQIKELAQRSTFSIAPYRQRLDFEMSIPNKIYDAMSLGKPILTSLNGAASELINTYSIGRTYNPEKQDSLYQELASLDDYDSELISTMGTNARDLYERHFQAPEIYSKLARDLIKLRIHSIN
jgi:glycosyltransferase involved in cell wall biosynthesis